MDSRYEIRGKLGQGGVGQIFRAYDTNLNREVAIKRLHTDDTSQDPKEAARGLLKEAMALSAIQHPHIVTVYDCGMDDEGPFVVMEILNGHSIEAMICEGTIVWEDFRELVLQTQDALIAAQNLGLVHRDLKPDNIMVVWLPSDKFQIKLVDFGTAEFRGPNPIEKIEKSAGLMGSIYFMAPEHFDNSPLEQSTDMYAIGAVYYYALTGEYPFNGESAVMVMAAHLQHHVKHLSELRPDLPKWACDWVMWHIERDMDKRPQNARESLKNFHGSERDTIEALLATGAINMKSVDVANGPAMKVDGESGLVQLSSPLMADEGVTEVKVEEPQKVSAPSPNEPDRLSEPVVANDPVVAPEPLPSAPPTKPPSLIAGLIVTIIVLVVIIGIILFKP